MALKPAESTPQCARAMFEILDQAGILAGVTNLVTAAAPSPIGAVVATHPEGCKLTFTGSTAKGKMFAP